MTTPFRYSMASAWRASAVHVSAWDVAHAGPPACSPTVPPCPALAPSPAGPRDDAVCPVCTEALAVGDEVQLLPCHAKHTFHVACLAPWLAQSNACPVCRQVGEAAGGGGARARGVGGRGGQ